MVKKFVLVVIASLLLMTMTACNITSEDADFSDMVVGEWEGEYNVVPIVYNEINKELGFDISTDPVYAGMYFTFNEDGTCLVELDAEEFSVAVGEIVEPYVSAIIGFDTGSMVDLLMQYVASNMDIDDSTVNGTYEVNNDTGEVIVQNEEGNTINLYFKEGGSMEFYEDEVDQTITLEKIS